MVPSPFYPCPPPLSIRLFSLETFFLNWILFYFFRYRTVIWVLFLTYPTSGCDSGLKKSQRGVCPVTPSPLRPNPVSWALGQGPHFSHVGQGCGGACFESDARFQVGVSILPIKIEHLLSLWFFSRFTFWKAKQVLKFYAILMKWEIVNVTKVIEKFPKWSRIHETLWSCETKAPTWLQGAIQPGASVEGSGVGNALHTVAVGCHGFPESVWGEKALGHNFM